MKKFIILSILTLFVSVSYANTDTTKTEPLTKEVIYKDIKAVISQLAEALKVGSEHVYGVLIKQQSVKAISNTVFVLLFCTLSIVFIKLFFNKYYDWRESDKESRYEWNAPTVLTCIGSVIFTIISVISIVVTFDSIITGFVNPEYSAIMTILELIK